MKSQNLSKLNPLNCVKLSVKMTVPAFSALAFLFNPNMNHEDILKEIHNKVYTCTLPNKLTIQAMICITMTYEVTDV